MPYEEYLEFFRELWSYSSSEAKFTYFFYLTEGKTLKPDIVALKDEDKDVLEQALEKIESLYPKFVKLSRKGVHVLFSVLPSSEPIPEGKRAKSEDIKISKVLWLDLDYKTEVTEESQEGLRELEDHALEGVVEIDGKKFRIKRPPISEVLKQIKEKLGVEPNYIIDSGTGYHIYFVLNKEISANIAKTILLNLVEIFQEADKQAKDLARLLRVPGTYNPKYGRLCRIIYRNLNSKIDPEELYSTIILQNQKKRSLELQREEERIKDDYIILDISEILKITDIIRDLYVPNHRQELLFALSGWLVKARIHILSAIDIMLVLREQTQDRDPIDQRADAIIYTYKKAGFDVEKYAKEISERLGVEFKERWKSPLPSEDEKKILGITGIRDIALRVYKNKERANAIIAQLQDILKYCSPFSDPVAIKVDHIKKIYFVADPKEQKIYRAFLDGETLKPMQDIILAYPKEVVVFEDPTDVFRTIKVTFTSNVLSEPLTVGPGTFEEILTYLRQSGLVINKNFASDALNAILNAYILYGRATIKKGIRKPGFYMLDNKIVVVEYTVREIDMLKLRQALELLNELAEVWYSNAKSQFSTIIKWGAVAPFMYILKKNKVETRWLYLWGESKTGKSTLGEIVLSLWGLSKAIYSIGLDHISTPAKLGRYLNSGTFPYLVNEAGTILEDEERREMIKHAVFEETARGKHIQSVFVEYLSLAPMIFTANYPPPADLAIRRRFIALYFGDECVNPPDKIQEFTKKILRSGRLNLLSEIGNAIANIVIKDPNLLLKSPDIIEIGRELLEKVYILAGMQTPEWLKEEAIECALYEELLELGIVSKLIKIINDTYTKQFGKAVIQIQEGQTTIFPEEKRAGEISIGDKAKALLENNNLAEFGIYYDNDKRMVYITRDFKNYIGLASLSFEEFARKIFKKETKTKVNPIEPSKKFRAVELSLPEFISLLELKFVD